MDVSLIVRKGTNSQYKFVGSRSQIYSLLKSNTMIGAIIGDTVGSIYEFCNIKTTEFPLFSKESSYTDDSIMSFAIADWLLRDKSHSMVDLKTKSSYTINYDSNSKINTRNLTIKPSV